MIRRTLMAITAVETLLLTPLPLLMRMAKTSTKLTRKRALHRARIFLKYHFRRRQKSPVIILSKRRSGSNLLLSYLNSVPALNFHPPEPLNPNMYYGLSDTRMSKKAVLNHLAYTLNDNPSIICGFKMLYIRLKKHNLTLSDIAGRFPNLRFIILYRRSLAEQFVSLKVAEKTDRWLWSPDAPSPGKIKIDPKEFEAFCAETRAFYEGLLQFPWIRGCSSLIAYEDLAADPQTLFDSKIFPFLGIHSAKVSTKMVKQITKPLEEILENPEVLKHEVLDLRGQWPADFSGRPAQSSHLLEDNP